MLILSTKRKEQDKIQKAYDKGRNEGMAISAATINFCLDGIPENTSTSEVIDKLKHITKRWKEYEVVAYNKQKEILKSIK